MFPRQANDAPPTILVVDDEPAIRELAASVLTDEGYVVLQACDGLAALDVVEKGGVDLVLSDIMMSRLDGQALVRRMRKHGFALPVVLMSAVMAAPDAKIPDVRFLPKPFDIDQLCPIMATALRTAGKARRSSRLSHPRSHRVSLIV